MHLEYHTWPLYCTVHDTVPVVNTIQHDLLATYVPWIDLSVSLPSPPQSYKTVFTLDIPLDMYISQGSQHSPPTLFITYQQRALQPHASLKYTESNYSSKFILYEQTEISVFGSCSVCIRMKKLKHCNINIEY
jgi:hypothetical protein